MSWTDGSGYAVSPDYLDPNSGTNQNWLKSNYYGGADSVNQAYKSMLDTGGIANPVANIGSGGNALGQATSIANSVGTSGGDWGNAASTIIGDYNNASTDTGSSALSGAVSGAIAGAPFGPVGIVAGGILGGLAGFFGSKSKKKQANQQFQNQLSLATAQGQQEQANYLQKQKLTQAAISPYGAAYQPNGFQYKNNLLKGGQALPQPQAGQLNIPNAPPSITSNGIGKPVGANIPGASFTPAMTAPSTTFQPQQPIAPMVPKYSGNAGTNQAAINTYGQNYLDYLNQQNQLQAAQAMDPYSAYYNQGQG